MFESVVILQWKCAFFKHYRPQIPIFLKKNPTGIKKKNTNDTTG